MTDPVMNCRLPAKLNADPLAGGLIKYDDVSAQAMLLRAMKVSRRAIVAQERKDQGETKCKEC